MNHPLPSELPILLVDDEPDILDLTRMTLTGEGFEQVLVIEDSRQVLPLLQEQPVAAIVLDLMMPNLSGTELLGSLASEHPSIPVIVMTAMDDVDTAVECLKSGAFDYLVKPVEPGRLVSVVQKAVRVSTLENENNSLKQCLLSDRLSHPEVFSHIITSSKKMRSMFQYTEVIARTTQPVLIMGETGVGKDLMASAIHQLSGVTGEFVTVNVAGLDDFTFSDTLFGHAKGAYTGAERSRDGLIQKATNGTLFLDEIGDLNLSSQVKLLRLLQSHEYYSLGSDALKSSNARIIVATNHDLHRLIAERKFRRDLYYRLCAYQLMVPPLRERTEDIPLLLDHFVRKTARSLHREVPNIAPRIAESLALLPFPGNIRELQAIVDDAVARNRSGILTQESFPCLQQLKKTDKESPLPFEASDALSRVFGRFPTMDEMEECMIVAAMKLAKQRCGVAATMLGITRQSLYRRLKRSPPCPARGDEQRPSA